MYHFFKMKAEQLEQRDIVVALQMDEVYVTPIFAHLSGGVSGMAEKRSDFWQQLFRYL